MTDKEIIKALECCIVYENCEGCPCAEDNSQDCLKATCKNSLDLINRLQDEREALINGQETLQKTIVEQKAEIERLEEEKRKLKNEMSYMSSPNTIGDRHEMGCW